MTRIDYTREIFSFSIAILVIGSFVYFFWYALTTKSDINTAKEVSALFGGYVAAVLVYYFGQKQAQNLTNQAVEARTEQEKFKKAYENDKSRIDHSTTNLNRLVNELENLKKQYGLE